VPKAKAKGRQWLEGHEWYRIDYPAGRMYYEHTVALCHYCHNYIHVGRLKDLLIKNMIPQAKYVAIIQHGERLLSEAGLPPRQVYTGPCAPWADWRLVLEGKEYPPLYETLEEWTAAHSTMSYRVDNG
jgi:hypothetical protein